MAAYSQNNSSWQDLKNVQLHVQSHGSADCIGKKHFINWAPPSHREFSEREAPSYCMSFQHRGTENKWFSLKTKVKIPTNMCVKNTESLIED